MAVTLDGALAVGAAAQLLGVTEKQVQHLGRRGEVRYVARGLLDGASVRALHASRQGKHTRGWSGRTAWGSVALLSGHDADWLGQAQVSRLRSRLRQINSNDLVAASRNRAVVGRFAGHQVTASRIGGEPSTVERRALPGLVGVDYQAQRDWYVDVRYLHDLVRTYGLLSESSGDFVLRAVATDDPHDREGVTIKLVGELMQGDVLAALDAATSEDPRERGIAVRTLDDALKRFRDDA